MPFPLIPLAIALGGSALGALGGKGKQGGQKTTNISDLSENTNTSTNQTQTTSGKQTTSSNLEDLQNQRTSGANIAVEDPLTSLFRYGVMGNLQKETQRAQNTPVFGDAQKASFMNNLNDLSDASFKSLSGNLARMGGLNSGAAAQGASDIETARFGNLSKFFSELPFQEEQARNARVQPLLGLSSALAGHGPISNFTTGESAGSRTAQQTGETLSEGTTNLTGTTTGNRQQQGRTSGENSVQGPSFLSGFLGNIGGLLGNSLGKDFDLLDLFKKKSPQYSTTIANPTGRP